MLGVWGATFVGENRADPHRKREGRVTSHGVALFYASERILIQSHKM
jgi:hypothetical protein